MKSFTRITCFMILAAVGGLLAGCCTNPKPHPPVQPTPETLLIPKTDMDLAWDETLEVLREHYFIPDRQDRREGLITTSPDISKQWFEFWRDDAVGCYDITESSVQTVRRSAEINFVPQGDKIEIRVEVTIQRQNQPQRQITSSSATWQAFREHMPLIITGRPAESGDIITWIDIGKDVRMANYLLNRIERRLPDSEVQFVECSIPVTTMPSPK